MRNFRIHPKYVRDKHGNVVPKWKKKKKKRDRGKKGKKPITSKPKRPKKNTWKELPLDGEAAKKIKAKYNLK